MANAEHVKILMRGVEHWNEWVLAPHNVGTHVDLTGTDLSGASLRNVWLVGADLHRANFAGADLCGAMLSDANLGDSDLRGANLGASNLLRTVVKGAKLSGVNLSLADLHGIEFRDADLEGANFEWALCAENVFINVDFSGADGLERVRHRAPSSLDIGTIVRSRGRIPEDFLRGCGVPQPFVLQMNSLVAAMEPIQFYSCFISYSAKNQNFADRLHADLQTSGVRCWFAPHDVKGGRKLHEQIDEAIRLYDRLLLILSADSMSSEWVKTEIAHARQKELNERRQVLFPISLVPFATIRKWECFDADIGKDSAREIREYFVPDFSNWTDHDSYQQAFERLVRDLNAGGPTNRLL